MGFNLHVIVLVFSLVFCIDDFGQCSSSCVARERHALVVFKNSLEDPTNFLSSWVGQDCCKWVGITCDNTTGHVTVLSLTHEILVRGFNENEYRLASNEVNPSLAELTHLDVLDLSFINFKGSQIPEFLGNFKELTRLSLIYGGFEGVVPPSLGNLSTLTHLRLSDNELLRVDSLNWLSPLTSLQVLDLSSTNCTGSQIPEFFGNFTELTVLVLLGGGFEGVVPPSLGNLSTLTTLGLSHNELLKVDSLNWLSPLTSLQELVLSYTNFTGSQIPEFFGNFTELTLLYLSGLGFEGVVPPSLGNLSTLTYLDLSYNELLRVDSLNWLSPLTSLESLDMGRVNLSLTSSHWPQVLRSFHSLVELDLNDCELYEFPLSHINNTFTTLGLSNNHFQGQFPSVFQNITSVKYLNLDGNMFSGLIPSFVNDTLSRIVQLDLSRNSFNGSVSNLCALGSNSSLPFIDILDLSKNYFSGVIPSDCWSHYFPQGLFLGNNDFTGVIPNTFKPYYSLQLGQNRFHGELPLSLKESQYLEILDIGENQFSGNLPSWIGSLSSLRILNLRQNKFGGVLNTELCRLHNLQIVDVSENNFSGIIPACFKNFGGMKPNLTHNDDVYRLSLGVGNLVQVIKGVELEYTTTLPYLFSLDLSSNNLDGSIPNELLSLTMLTSLNLSNNRLTGGIPKKIGDLNALESLDFSRNQLSGVIPQSIAIISSLAVLNLSYNNLEGQIPYGPQLQTFESPSYAGNPALCGVPLEKKCSQKDSSQGTEEYKVFESKEYYIGMALGIATGFWGLLLILMFKQTWRYTCFRFVENIYDLLFVK